MELNFFHRFPNKKRKLYLIFRKAPISGVDPHNNITDLFTGFDKSI